MGLLSQAQPGDIAFSTCRKARLFLGCVLGAARHSSCRGEQAKHQRHIDEFSAFMVHLVGRVFILCTWAAS